MGLTLFSHSALPQQEYSSHLSGRFCCLLAFQTSITLCRPDIAQSLACSSEILIGPHSIYIFNFQNAKNQIFTLEILIPSLSWEITSCGYTALAFLDGSSLQMSPCIQVAKAPPAGFTPIINCLVHTGIWYCHRWKLAQDKYGQVLFFLFLEVTNIMSRYKNHFQEYKSIKHLYEIMNCNDIALRNPTLSLFL